MNTPVGKKSALSAGVDIADIADISGHFGTISHSTSGQLSLCAVTITNKFLSHL
jgi:hypothetical protein